MHQMNRLLIVAAALVAAVAMALPGAAAAKRHPLKQVRHHHVIAKARKATNFRHTYPVASRLCAAAARGKLPKRLAGSLDQVQAACTDLENAFAAARSALKTTAQPLVQQLKALPAQVRSACATARQSGDRSACRQARHDAIATARQLAGQLKTALVAYRNAVNAARSAFWSAIRALPGGAGLHQDAPISTPTAP